MFDVLSCSLPPPLSFSCTPLSLSSSSIPPVSLSSPSPVSLFPLHPLSSYAHPYLLADNRHYPFYLWKNIFKRHANARYWLVPLHTTAVLLMIYVLSELKKFNEWGEPERAPHLLLLRENHCSYVCVCIRAIHRPRAVCSCLCGSAGTCALILVYTFILVI